MRTNGKVLEICKILERPSYFTVKYSTFQNSTTIKWNKNDFVCLRRKPIRLLLNLHGFWPASRTLFSIFAPDLFELSLHELSLVSRLCPLIYPPWRKPFQHSGDVLLPSAIRLAFRGQGRTSCCPSRWGFSLSAFWPLMQGRKEGKFLLQSAELMSSDSCLPVCTLAHCILWRLVNYSWSHYGDKCVTTGREITCFLCFSALIS